MLYGSGTISRHDSIRNSARSLPNRPLHTLRQTNSVANYVNAFQNLVINIPTMFEEDRLDWFMRGLKNDIYECVALQQPATLAEACRMAHTAHVFTLSLSHS